MVLRLLHARHGRVGPLVAARVARLARDRSVLVVSCRLPAPFLRRDLEAAGADLAHVFLLDASGQGIPGPSRDPEHEGAVPGPAMLELIAKRTQQVIRAKAERPVTVVVDDVATLARYNSVDALVEALQYAAALRQEQTVHEYLFTGLEPPALLPRVWPLMHEEADLAPSGEAAPLRSAAPGPDGSAGDGAQASASAVLPRPPTGLDDGAWPSGAVPGDAWRP